MKKLYIGVITFLSILCIGVVTFMITIMNIGFRNQNSNLTLVNTRTISLDEVASLEVKYIAENITIYETDSDKLILKEYMNRDNSKYYASVSENENSVTIKHGSRMNTWFLRGKIELYIPSSYTNQLSIATTSGTIASDHQMVHSSFEASSVSGSIILDHIESSDIDLATTSGKITAEQLNGSGRVKSVSGSIRINSGTFDGDFATTSGKIHLTPEEISGDTKIKSVSGSVTLTASSRQSFEVSASSTSGSINTWFEKAVNKTNKNKISGTVGSSPEFSLSVKTTSGGIHIID